MPGLRLLERLGPDCEVAVEVTGNAFELYDALSPHWATMVLANPAVLKRFGSGEEHADRVGAARLAKMMAINTAPRVWVPPQEVREVRRLLRYRFKLVQQQVPGKNQGRVKNVSSILQAEGQINVDTAGAAILVSAARLLTSLETERRSIEAEIARRLEEHPGAKLRLSVPGVGIITAAAIWAWIGGPGKFHTSKQVASHAGLDPSVHQSVQD